ncbi:helitron_like_N domain-containing protein [Trichonephila clavipes]|nr:helitron_like_N domain-containing protein [Trichonephila clavipes]
MYPVVVSRQFMIRVNALVTFMLNDDEVFCDKEQDYWWRKEFQNRRSPHLHMVVWINNHLLLDTPEELQRIDHVFSCELTVQDAELLDLVRKLQIHRHSHTCGKKGPNSRCRYGYLTKSMCTNTYGLT